MFSIQVFLTCKTKFPDELQTHQPDCKISGSQFYKSPAQHHTDFCTACTQQVLGVASCIVTLAVGDFDPTKPVNWLLSALN